MKTFVQWNKALDSFLEARSSGKQVNLISYLVFFEKVAFVFTCFYLTFRISELIMLERLTYFG